MREYIFQRMWHLFYQRFKPKKVFIKLTRNQGKEKQDELNPWENNNNNILYLWFVGVKIIT